MCCTKKKIVATQEKELPIDTYTEEEKKSHGRTETRKIAVFKASTELPKKWQALVKYFIVITRSGTRNNKPYEHTHYYVSNNYQSAAVMAKGIRGHWGIESYHWIKDVVCREDDCLTQTTKGAVTISILYDAAMNIFKLNGYKSMKAAFEEHTNKVDKMIQLNGLIKNKVRDKKTKIQKNKQQKIRTD